MTSGHDTVPSDWIKDIPKLSVSGEITIDDLRSGPSSEKLKEDLSGAGLTHDQIRKIENTLLGLRNDIGDFYGFRYTFGEVNVSTIRQLDEDELAFILRSETDASIVKKLFD